MNLISYPEKHRLDTRVAPGVRIENASFDESAVSSAGIVVRGRVAAATLRFLKVDPEYQRKLENRPDIFQALKNGVVVPDIDIGVRGQSYHQEGEDVVIDSPAYIIDGSQRVGTALALLELIPDMEVRIGALVHFDTTQAWEAARFTSLNVNAKRVSPSLHLRNLRDSNTALLTLYGLSNNTPSGVLHGRVCWEQTMQGNQLLNAFTVAKVARDMHAHLTPISGVSLQQVASDIAFVAERQVSLSRFRQNVSQFFETVDQCWGIRSIKFRKDAPQIKTSFLSEFARFISLHENFWEDDGKTLHIDTPWRQCLSRFPIQDGTIKHLASSGGPARRLLYTYLEDHASSGKRVNKLIKRAPRR